MRRVVLDAGAVLAWFDPESPHRALRSEYEAGTLSVVASSDLVASAMGQLARRTALCRGFQGYRCQGVGCNR